MTDALARFLRARLDEARAALLAYRDGHPGPCLNFEGQDPEEYDEHDSCHLHLQAAAATPYRDVAFGLAEVDAKRRLLDEHALVHRDIIWLADGDEETDEIPVCRTCVPHHSAFPDRASVPEGPCRTVRLLALPYAGHPYYRQEWKP